MRRGRNKITGTRPRVCLPYGAVLRDSFFSVTTRKPLQNKKNDSLLTVRHFVRNPQPSTFIRVDAISELSIRVNIPFLFLKKLKKKKAKSNY